MTRRVADWPRRPPLPGARRKALMLKLARLGADRIHVLMDPQDPLA